MYIFNINNYNRLTVTIASNFVLAHIHEIFVANLKCRNKIIKKTHKTLK